jgi:Family of unknown function (DUF6165)
LHILAATVILCGISVNVLFFDGRLLTADPAGYFERQHHVYRETTHMIILVPEAVGDLIDKITILQIKVEYLSSPEKLKNVQYELGLLQQICTEQKIEGPALEEKMVNLKAINAAMWEIEDRIRECERRKDFGARFIELARSVYKINDQRAAAKREINALFGSIISEEKSYAPY